MKNELEIRQSEREKISQHLHDVIANELLHLQFLILKSENEINKESFVTIVDELEFIRNQVRNISHGISTIKSHKFVNLAQTLKELLLDYTFLFPELTFSYNVFPKNFSFSFIESKQQEITIVVKELIQNALQHGKPNFIEISITEFETEVNIMIEDNGSGFNTEFEHEGIGLNNCKKRIKEINGSIIIDSTIEKGTSINITISK